MPQGLRAIHPNDHLSVVHSPPINIYMGHPYGASSIWDIHMGHHPYGASIWRINTCRRGGGVQRGAATHGAGPTAVPQP
eukprot:351030-Chlamydomonas_euryale.AAC.2